MSTYHKKISYIKSAVRLAGYCALPFNIWAGAAVLFVSEIFGFMEEKED